MQNGAGPRSSGAQTRYWIFTYNNPIIEPEELIERWKGPEGPCTFLVFQKERGEEGTEHYQGYCELSTRGRWSKLQRCLPSGQFPHFERRMGTQSQAIEYVTKEDTRIAGPFQWGEPSPDRPGRRNDLEGFTRSIRSGARARDLLESHATELARYPKFYSLVLTNSRPAAREQPPKIELLVGPPGCGKTRYVWDKHGESNDFYVAPISTSGFWMDGYDGHKYCLLDDFGGRASKISAVQLLRLLDRYPLLVPYKGGYTWWYPEVVYITSNYHPNQWYDWSGRHASFAALQRRITVVRKWNDDFESSVFEEEDGVARYFNEEQ